MGDVNLKCDQRNHNVHQQPIRSEVAISTRWKYVGDFDCLYIDKHMHYTSQLSSEDFVTTSHETEFTSC